MGKYNYDWKCVGFDDVPPPGVKSRWSGGRQYFLLPNYPDPKNPYKMGKRPHYRDSTPKMGWSAMLKALRWDVMGMYQRDFAKLLDISQESLSSIERGKYRLHQEALNKFLNILHQQYDLEFHRARPANNKRGRKKTST